MDIILLRHGKTHANEAHLYCGSTDLPLSENGLNELESLKRSAKYPDISGYKIYTSGMRRANETLNVLYGNMTYFVISDMRELDFGAFELRSYDELKDAPRYIAWISDTTGTLPCPGGESSAQFKARIFEAYDALARQNENALVVCHGGVIAELMAHLFPEADQNFYEWQPKAGHGYKLHYTANSISYTPIPG